MGGGILDLVSRGAEDIILSGNPQITLFKCIYRRYTNFSQDDIKFSVEGKQDFGTNFSSKVVRGADLLTGLFLEITLPEICMKYSLTKAEEIQYQLNSVGVVQEGLETPIQAINRVIANNNSFVIIYKNILTMLQSMNPGKIKLIDLVNLLIPLMPDNTIMLNLAQYLLSSSYYSEGIQTSYTVSCDDGSVTTVTTDTTTSQLIFLEEFLDKFYNYVFTGINGTPPDTQGPIEFRVLEQVESVVLSSCTPDEETKLQKFISLLKIEEVDKTGDIFKYLIYLDKKANPNYTFSEYQQFIKQQIWKIMFISYLNLVNILRSLAEDIGDNLIFKGTDTSIGVPIISQILPVPSKSYYRYSAQAFSDVLGDYTYFGPPSSVPLVSWDFSSGITDFLSAQKSDLISENTATFVSIDQKLNIEKTFGPNGFTCNPTCIANNLFYDFRTLVQNYAYPSGYYTPLGQPLASFPENIYYMNGFLLNYNKFIYNMLVQTYPGPLPPGILALYNTNLGLLAPYIFNLNYVPDLINDNNTINLTLNSQPVTSNKNIIFLFDKNPLYTTTWIENQWLIYTDVVKNLYETGQVTDPKSLRVLKSFFGDQPACVDTSLNYPTDVKINITDVCINPLNVNVPDITTPATNPATLPVPNCAITIFYPQPPEPDQYPPDYDPTNPPLIYNFTNTTFLNEELNPDYEIWNLLMSRLTNNYNIFYSEQILNIQNLANIGGATTVNNFQTSLTNLINAINTVYPSLIDLNNIQYNLLGNHDDPPNSVVVNEFIIDAIDTILLDTVITPSLITQMAYRMGPYNNLLYPSLNARNDVLNYAYSNPAGNVTGISVPCRQFFYGSTDDILSYIVARIANDGSGNPATLAYFMSPGFNIGNFNYLFQNGTSAVYPGVIQQAVTLMQTNFVTVFDIINNLKDVPPLTPSQAIDWAPFFDSLTINSINLSRNLLNNSFNSLATPHDLILYLVYRVFLDFIPQLSDSGLGLTDYILNSDFQNYLLKKITELESQQIPLLTAKAKINDANARSDTGCAKFAWIRRIGHYIIKKIEIEIGGVIIDRQYGDWIDIWYELTRDIGKDKGYNKMIGDIPELYNFDNNFKPETKLTIPLPFWFCRMPGSYLPLPAMQYQDVIIRGELRDLDYVSITEDNTYYSETFTRTLKDSTVQTKTYRVDPKIKIGMYGRYIYLDNTERKRIAGTRHEYLMEYTQDLEPAEVNRGNIPVKNTQVLNPPFEHSCKYFVWYAQYDRNVKNKRYNVFTYDDSEETYSNLLKKFIRARMMFQSMKSPCDLTPTTCPDSDNIYWSDLIQYRQLDNGDSGKQTIQDSYMKFNSQKRFSRRKSDYFNYVQPWQYFPCTPQSGVQVYSYALGPTYLQPSGTVNCSRLNKIKLYAKLPQKLVDIINTYGRSVVFRMYAMTSNIIRVFSGFCGLAFF